jgi:hypothetical protein
LNRGDAAGAAETYREGATDGQVSRQRIRRPKLTRTGRPVCTGRSERLRARFVYWCKDPVRDLVFSLRFEEPCFWHVNSTVHEKYQRHLNAHIKMSRVNQRTNRIEYYWRELHSDDHLLDCECMNATRAVQLGLVPLIAENPQAYEQASLGFR